MLQTKTLEVDGVKFDIGQLPYRKGSKVLLRLMRVVAPGLKALVPEGVTKEQLQDMSFLEKEVDFMALVPALVQGLHDDDFDYLLNAFGEVSICRKGTEHIPMDTEEARDTIFDQNYMMSMRWLVTAIKHNFGNFSQGGGQKAPSQTKNQ